MAFAMREADEHDIDFIQALFALPHAREYLEDPGREAIVAELESAQTEAYIVEEDGREVGYFTLRDLGWLFELRVLIVRKEGRGAGTFAMRWGAAHAFERGAHRIYIEIREDNGRARTMCERLGFKAEGLFRDGARDPSSGRFKNLVPYGMLRGELGRVS